MLPKAILGSISRIRLPEHYYIDTVQDGLPVKLLRDPETEIGVTLEPFRSRGDSCRRVLARLEDGRRFVLEFSKFDEAYGDQAEGAIRARQPIVDGHLLCLDTPRYREDTIAPTAVTEVYEEVRRSWTKGIRYNAQLVDDDERVVRMGLSTPQTGALHAVASHWTLTSDPACIVLPTGTGKTEVMIAAAVGAASQRVLVIVSTDALRQQTADKFKSYGILHEIGIIDELPNPIVGILASRPMRAPFASLANCNVVVSTMSSIGFAAEDVQEEFAGLFSHIFFDEAHHIEAATWKRFQKYAGSAQTLLLTATPFREDGTPLPG